MKIYLELARELKKNCGAKSDNPIFIDALGTIPNGLEKKTGGLEIGERIETFQTTGWFIST